MEVIVERATIQLHIKSISAKGKLKLTTVTIVKAHLTANVRGIKLLLSGKH